MVTKTLSAEITANITQLKKLKENDPTNQELIALLQDMYDALHKAQGKEWEEQVKEYKEAKKALAAAKRTTQAAINDLSKVAEAITIATSALAKIVPALAVLG